MPISEVYRTCRTNPKYLVARSLGRFPVARKSVAWATSAFRPANQSVELPLDGGPITLATNVSLLVRELEENGVAFGLQMPATTVAKIREFAATNPCFADRKEHLGFGVNDREAVESKIGKPVLVAQYFNVVEGCDAIRELAESPLVREIARRYLRSEPTFVGANLWWTFAVNATEQDRHEHAHLFHRDVDDFRFFKFFFYLTDVEPGDGGHVLVKGSHRHLPSTGTDRWKLRRYSDAEVEGRYPPENIVEITGPAGTGFVEDTFCVHKGRTPSTHPRLLLQLQFALFDYGTLHDVRPHHKLVRAVPQT